MAAEAWQQFDCYKVLGVHVAAAPVAIRQAYYRASRAVHPDLGGSHEAQVRVNLAYEVLADPVTRQSHDLFWYRFRAPGVGVREAPFGVGGSAAAANQPLEALLQRVREALGHEGRVGRPTPVGGHAGGPAAGKGPAPLARAAPVEAAPPLRAGRARRGYFATASALSGLALGASLEGFHALWLGAGIGWLAFAATGVGRGPRRSACPRGRAMGDAAAVRPGVDARGDAPPDGRDPRLARYVSAIAALSGLLLRPTDLDDSEEQVARRVTATLFMMGYKPLGFDRRYRLLLFTDGEERLLIRFRHRSGPAVNVAYVQGMVDAMEYTGSAKGILFCAAGLSGNGEELAARHGIRWYSLSRMNEWIDSVIRARYAGPPGNILKLLEEIVTFVNHLSTPLPVRRPGAGR